MGLNLLFIGFKTAYILYQNGLISFCIQQIFLGFSIDPVRLRLSWSIQFLQYDKNCRIQAFLTTEVDESGDQYLLNRNQSKESENFQGEKSIKLNYYWPHSHLTDATSMCKDTTHPAVSPFKRRPKSETSGWKFQLFFTFYITALVKVSICSI